MQHSTGTPTKYESERIDKMIESEALRRRIRGKDHAAKRLARGHRGLPLMTETNKSTDPVTFQEFEKIARLNRDMTSEQVPVLHYGPVYRRSGPFGESLAACAPGPVPSNLTTHKPWVTCETCKQTEAYRNGSSYAA